MKNKANHSPKILLIGMVIVASLVIILPNVAKQDVKAASSFRFISWGDTKRATATLSELSDQAVPLNPAFTIYQGDLEENGFTQSGMDDWKEAMDGQLSGDTAPNGMFDITFPIRGNHDNDNAEGWQNYFNLSQTADRVGAENYTYLSGEDDLVYSFDFDNAHFIGLDVLGNVDVIPTEQINWLDEDLTAAETRGLTHAFIYFHGPIYCVDGHCSCEDRVCAMSSRVQELIEVMNKHPIITATFHGHEHTYAYTYIDETRIPPDGEFEGVTHPFHQFVTGDAGAGPRSCNANRCDFYMAEHGFITVDVSDLTLTVNWYELGSDTPVETRTFVKEGEPSPTSTPSPTMTPTPLPSDIPPPNFKVAFIGDASINNSTRSVFQLIKDEGAHMVLHQGDIDNNEQGQDSPQIYDQMINDILGEDFPYFIIIGNHDVNTWDGANGLQALFEARLARISGAECIGEYGVMASCSYKGIFFIQSGVGTLGGSNDEHEAYIREQLAQDHHLWRICTWHKQMHEMQVGEKGNATGWGVYEACREGGAFVANGHEHSYARTYLMDNFENQSIANTSQTLELQEGNSFAFHSGLGGCSIRNQDQDWSWFDAVYTSDQGANFGALFCTFNIDGQVDHASCYFKDIDGEIPDEFELVSKIQGGPTSSFTDVPTDHWAFDYIETLYQNGYVAGCNENPLMYCPDDNMTRAESAVFVERGIWNAEYMPPQPTEQVFADVSLAEWFAKWATGLWNDGYTAGCGTNPLIYCPLQEHTMAEGAVFYLRMLNGPDYEPPDPTGIFQDVTLTEWYARWVEAAYNAGIYPACQTEPQLLACPEDPLTRAMGAYMMVMAKDIPLE